VAQLPAELAGVVRLGEPAPVGLRCGTRRLFGPTDTWNSVFGIVELCGLNARVGAECPS
jgi:hypothetical protein